MKKASLFLFLSFVLSSLSLAQNTITKEEVEPFMDGVIQTLMDEHHIAGVTVSIVKDTAILWSKGYGFSDVENNVVVDPAISLFRIGSVSKLFVWTAIMQLYEEGKINLDADIRFLTREFNIPYQYDQPVTMKHLMSHTPGFEDYYLNLFSTDSLPPRSLGEELSKHMPTQVRPPGVHSSYSNHGTAVAAYIVEEVSGLKWDDYVEKMIFEPLEMNNTTFRYILPDNFKINHSGGYVYESGKHTSKSLKGIPLAPAGLASSTAEDMAPFMMAHLNHGKYKNARILDSATVNLMHSTLFTPDPDLKGMLYGFFDHSKNGRKIIGHGGATEYFFTHMLLLVDEGYGIFISTNTLGGYSLIKQATTQFIDKYFPDTLDTAPSINTTPEVLDRFKGEYITNRRPITKGTKIISLLSPYLKVDHNDTHIVISNRDEITHWYPLGLKTFQNTKSTHRIAFGKGDGDDYKYLYMDESPHVTYEKVRFIESKKLHYTLFFGSILLGLFAALYWMLVYFFRKSHRIRTRRKLSLTTKSLAVINPLLCIAFLVVMTTMLGSDFLFRPIKLTDYILFAIPAFIAFFTFFQLVKAIQLFSKNMPVRTRLFYLLLTLSMVCVVWQFLFWNLLGFQY